MSKGHHSKMHGHKGEGHSHHGHHGEMHHTKGQSEHEHDHHMKHAKTGSYHGSPKETHRIHSGEVGVPNHLPAASPGKSAETRGTSVYTNYFEGGKSDYKPKGMKTYREE